MAAAKLRCTPGAVGFVLSQGVPGGPYWLNVRCSWCGGTVHGGCLRCAEAVHRLWAVNVAPEFRALQGDAGRDPAVLGVLLDWLAEQGIEAEGLP